MGLDPFYIDQIKGFEGYSPTASWDYKQDSVGFGTRARFPGEQIDRNEAERRLHEETSKASQAVSAFHPRLDPGTHAALTSLTFNAGPGWMNAGLGQAVKSGDMDRARSLFAQYNKAGGETLPGLANRRAAELQWFGGGPPPVDGARGMYDESYDPLKTTAKIAQTLAAPAQGQSPMTASPMISAVYDPNELTPEAVALQRKIAMGLLGQGSDISPVGHPLAALARTIQGGVGGYQRDTANDAEKAAQAREMAFIQSLANPQAQRAVSAAPTSVGSAPSSVAPPQIAAPSSAPAPAAPSIPGTAPPLPAPMGPNGQRLPLPSEMRPPINSQDAPPRSPRMTEEQYQAWRASIISQPGYLRLSPEKRKVVDEMVAQRAPIQPKLMQAEGDIVDTSDPNNVRVIYRGSKPTEMQRDYESYAKQTRAAGQEPMSQYDYAIKMKQAGVAQPENSFENATAKAQASRLEKLVEAGDTARGFRGQMDILREHSRNIGNAGAMATIKQRLGPLATAAGVPLDNLDDIQAFQSIIEKVAPTMRAPGSGATSDIEYQGFLKSLPQMSATAQGREMILNQLSAIARDAEMRGEIASRVQNGEIGRKQASEVLKRLPDVMSYYREYQASQPKQPAVGAKPVRVNSPDEAAALPSGTPFMTPDGRTMVKR